MLEELTTTWVFWRSADCAVAVVPRSGNNFLLAIAGLAILAGPAVVSLLAKR
ncbi:YbhQ family protein [Escherichia coli]